MRDINRIDRILKMYGEIWKRNPDQRFCQLYVNLFGRGDNFYIEDDIIEKHLAEVLINEEF